MKKIFLIIIVAIAAFFFLVVGGLVYMGLKGPEISVVPGQQLAPTHYNTIRDLGLLEEGEKIKFFYSDALMDITNGFYFFTEDKMVIYSKDFVKPANIITYPEIKEIRIERNDSFWEDSRITIVKTDDEMTWFPVSSEDGGDKNFYESLTSTWNRKKSDGDPYQ